MDRVIDVDGAEYRILSDREDAAGDRPTYLLVHGIGMSQRSQRLLHDRLARTGTVYSVDLPGFGRMDAPAGGLPIDGMAQGLGRALDELGLKDIVLVGHSMGAQWVVELGAQRPDLIAGVVVVGPVVDDRARSAAAQSVRLTLDSLVEPPHANLIVVRDYLRSGPRWYVNQLRHMLRYPIDVRVAQLDMPFLVIRGGRDPISGSGWCRRLRDAAPRGSMAVVPGAPHNVQLTAAPAVASAIEAFAGSIRAAAT